MNVSNPDRCTIRGSAVVAAIASAMLAGCVGAGVEESVLPIRIDYRCAHNKVLQIQRAGDASAAAVLIDNKPVVLPRADSAAQEKYSDGTYALYLDGERAMLEQNSRVIFGPCTAGPLPKAVRERY
ncbi:MAG: MliC family protein [Betaproteobacteria bacterium]|jgi:membrane-bound inhibitor of C-type lysozyme|nr:MliC family protein [Betaproteobacteria bacterium]MDH4294469.1 MliC family protein [Betaproteobacteria bacterium]MDH5341247.1 MliC family protein [Betaproteobacteria bacterium]